MAHSAVKKVRLEVHFILNLEYSFYIKYNSSIIIQLYLNSKITHRLFIKKVFNFIIIKLNN